MDVVKSPSGEFSFPLAYEIRIGCAGSETFPASRSKELFGDVWADFWERFVGEICYPVAGMTVPPDTLKFNSHLSEFSARWLETGHALPLYPTDLETGRIAESHHYLRLNSAFVLRHGRGARPSTAFAAKLTSKPQTFLGEWFAIGAGNAFDEQGKLQFGVVLNVELEDFEAQEGSLIARGIVVLKFFGVGLLLPLFVKALAPPVTAEMEKFRIKQNIEGQLSGQIVVCEVTGGFHFSRADLIEKFEHRLNVQGPSGICEMQSALAALGYSPGQIDGKAGPRSLAAAKAFASAWGLSAADINKPVFFNFIARALAGERPQSK